MKRLVSRRQALLGGVALAILPSRLQSQSQQYTYDALGRLIGVKNDDGMIINYTYDLSGNRTRVVVQGVVEGPPPYAITPARAKSTASATDGWWYDISQVNSTWSDRARTQVAPVGSIVKVVDDLAGFGNALVFPDGREPILQSVSGRRFLLFSGETAGLIGNVGGMRFPQFTVFLALLRDPGATGVDTLIFSGLRSRAATSANYAYLLSVRDTQTASFKVHPANSFSSGSNTTTAPRGKPLVLSHRSTDGTLRTGHDSSGIVLRLDATDTPTAAYPLANQQPMLGASIDEAGVFEALFQGRFYGGAMFNVAVSDGLRLEIERQFGSMAGLSY